ncbi:MAG: hypothetical protein QW404_01950 [Candidatus Nanoarchaeia archaeon]
MEELTDTKKWILAGLFVIAALITYFLFTSENVILIKVVVVALLFVFLVFFTFYLGVFKQKVILPSESSDMLRYTMSCRSCGWEWMSNVTKKALAPTKCPNCGDDKLEILGWRRVKVLNKKNKDLKEFIH